MYLISALAQYKMDAFTLIFVATSKKELTSFSDRRKKKAFGCNICSVQTRLWKN
jgi:hypothetical protein